MKVAEPYAFTFATATPDGRPSNRILYMRDISPDGLVCFTNYKSHKGREIDANPYFSGNFFWSELMRQIRFSGKVEKLDGSRSDAYFNSRPRESQLGAWASAQSEVIRDRAHLNELVEKFRAKFEGKDVPRPEFWGGYVLRPEHIEFWQGQPSRLHDRIRYSLQDGIWAKVRLSP